MNENGHPPTLVAAHPGNRNRYVHGLLSARPPEMTEEGRAIVDAILDLPHVSEADLLVVERLAMLTLSVRRVEAALADGHVENRRGEARKLLDVQRRLSAEIRVLSDALGLTPAARATWTRVLVEGSLRERINRRLAELDEREATG